MRNARGFTLIETIVYIALLALIVGGAIAVVYGLLGGQGRASAHDVVEGEGNFVLGKFAYAMGQITATDTPSLVSPYTHELAIQSGGKWVQLCLSGSAVLIREAAARGVCGDARSLPLTTGNVSVTSLSFHYIPTSGAAPDGIEASTTIDGVVFDATHYLRK